MDRRAPPCACVFDVDKTITCGSPEKALELCQDAKCAVAINTARPRAWLEPNLQALGFPSPSSPLFLYNPQSYHQTAEERAQVKAQHMRELAVHLQTDNLVLFDDLEVNVNAVRSAGFRAQLVGRRSQCGVDEADVHEALQGNTS